MTTRYVPGGVTVKIGRSQEVSLPAPVVRGRATCMHFDTDKAFLLPASIPGVRNMVAFIARHPGKAILVNGHTDLRGSDSHNLQLSKERADAMVAYLTNQVDAWLAWYGAASASKRWSFREDQNMLATVVDPSNAPYYSGPIHGQNDAATQDAARRFQIDNGLDPDGQLGPDTRRALVGRYMALEKTTLPPGANVTVHGCGKFHPIDPVDGDDLGNRRVEIFLFDGPVDPAPVEPCPTPGCTQYAEWVGQSIDDLDLCCARFPLDVVVLDDATPGNPIEGATVTIDAPGVAPIVTAADGTAQFIDLPAGTYFVEASRAGFTTRSATVTVPGDAPASAPSAGLARSALVGTPGTRGGSSGGAGPGGSATQQVITLAGNTLDVTVNWGQRSLARLGGPASFWLTVKPGASPASLGIVPSRSGWDTATPTPIAMTVGGGGLQATGKVPVTALPALVRLDFKLVAPASLGAAASGAGGPIETLGFQQLLSIDAGGVVTDVAHVITGYTMTRASAAAQSGNEGRVAPTKTRSARREFPARHPLLQIDPAKQPLKPQLIVDAEFIDVTESFWAAHAAADGVRWYLHPDLGGRADNLRVLAWTGGDKPMIWFAAPTDDAVQTLVPPGVQSGADIVFFRPVGSDNSFFYPATAAGFLAAKHRTTTLFILPRYLLSPIQVSPLTPTSPTPPIIAKLTAQGLQTPGHLGDVISNATKPSADPMTDATNFPAVFQPVGLEGAIAASNQPHVLFLPLGHDAATATDLGGYRGAMLPDQKRSIGNALAVLWTVGAVGTKDTDAPDFSVSRKRQLWIAGHSAANAQMTNCLNANSADVDRLISHDAKASFGPILFTMVAPAIGAAAAVRKKKGKSFEAFIITSPHIDDTPQPSVGAMNFQTVDMSRFAQQTKAGATIVLLPDLNSSQDKLYWQISPAAALSTNNPFMRNLLSRWTDAQIDASAKHPNNWFFLFFHEFAVFGGHRESSFGGGVRVRTFFEDALGAASGGALTVTVTDASGAVVPNAEVAVRGPMVRFTAADAKGSVTLERLLPGLYKVFAGGRGFVENDTQATVTAGTTTSVSIDLHR